MGSSPPTKNGDSGSSSDDDGYSSDSTITNHLLEKEKGYGMSPTEDLEAQQHITLKEAESGKQGAEYSVPARTKYTYLGLYFGLNLSLTLFNKAVLGKFAFPWLLTTIHTGTAALGCSFLLSRGHFQLTTLTTRENVTLLAFSVLYTINIAISNVSLEMVSVSFHQIMRSTSPLFTILIYRLWYARLYAMATYVSLLPIILGAALTTYGDYYFTPLGFFLTLLGVILAALKTVATNRLMTGNLKLPALELLFRMSPLAAIQSLVFALFAGELAGFFNWVAQGSLSVSYGSALAGNGLLAFFLNIASLHTNKLAGALTMSICANLKQCLTVLLGIVLFDTKIGVVSAWGMVVTLAGAAVYSKVELQLKTKNSAVSQPNAKPLDPLGSENSREGSHAR
ncbi:uncharacterized protein KY384_002971 [Bacidia gigantensis]|uniref:uncharacterized protein n=1 Tax=Bacidia gigantensis TaxID=2732470 RepID=UPI001D037D16|nr:uncharacterized protein KY384_002971 [Bacidia gigantensis]KAG8531342.1 hypothetical protein KY384_002971 [Bacidia gigantensis]